MIVTIAFTIDWEKKSQFELFEVQTSQINFGKHIKTLTPKAYSVTGPIKLDSV